MKSKLLTLRLVDEPGTLTNAYSHSSVVSSQGRISRKTCACAPRILLVSCIDGLEKAKPRPAGRTRASVDVGVEYVPKRDLSRERRGNERNEVTIGRHGMRGECIKGEANVKREVRALRRASDVR